MGWSMRTLLIESDWDHETVVIEGDEAHHGRSVLRLAVGDELRLTDGRGSSAEAVLVAVERHRLVARITSRCTQPPGLAQQLTICCASPKGSRFEDLVRGLTELGVGAICPLDCERSVREPKLDRARRVAAEAIKQCGRVWLPQVGPVVEFTALAKHSGRLILLDREGQAPVPGPATGTTILVGPEGGFSASERSRLLDWGAEPVRLAQPILRIETAALAAAAVWVCAWEHHER
jgi:16S rRNA (uracil1498-N3)-methyltransferase